ncbi:MAG: beta-glucosidase, partial [Clostridia bacterium]|nr:beta-glucosidase [Clostridia bacterium]
MSSFNRIGDRWCGASSALLKNVLRDEWGFLGTVITDYNGQKYMHVENGVNSGNDLMLGNEMTLPTKFTDTKNPSTIRIMREACKNIFFTQVNSSTVNETSDATVITYGTAPWRAWLTYANIGLGALALLLVLLTVFYRRRRNIALEK